jgi:transcriptional pleiotropic regulator of transition state genes
VLSTGVSRRLDRLGRVVLPIELRRTLHWVHGTPVGFFTDADHLVLRKHATDCLFCEEGDVEESTWRYHGAYVCPRCREALRTLAQADPLSPMEPVEG